MFAQQLVYRLWIEVAEPPLPRGRELVE